MADGRIYKLDNYWEKYGDRFSWIVIRIMSLHDICYIGLCKDLNNDKWIIHERNEWVDPSFASAPTLIRIIVFSTVLIPYPGSIKWIIFVSRAEKFSRVGYIYLLVILNGPLLRCWHLTRESSYFRLWYWQNIHYNKLSKCDQKVVHKILGRGRYICDSFVEGKETVLAAASTTFCCRYSNRNFNTFIPNNINLT